MRVLLATPELAPYVQVGEAAAAIREIATAFAALGHDLRLVIPGYGGVDWEALGFRREAGPVGVPVGRKEQPLEIWEGRLDGQTPVYLAANPHFFGGRRAVYGESDDAYRFAFFSRAVLSLLHAIDWQPEVIHAFDWPAGLLPLYQKQLAAYDQAMARTASVFTFHSLSQQGLFGVEVLDFARIDRHQHFHLEGVEYYGQANYLKAGIIYSDLVSTISKRYAEMIQLAEFGEGLSGLLLAKRDKLQGINSGIDTALYDPQRDPALMANYDPQDLRGKEACKLALQKRLGLAVHSEIPLIAVMTNRASRRELELVLANREKLRRLEVQLVIWGSEGGADEDSFWEPGGDAVLFTDRQPEAVRSLYAGADIALYPAYLARFPAGIMVSLRYGAVPIVYTAKEHFDVIVNHEGPQNVGNTFTFNEYSASGLYKAVRRSIEAYRQLTLWQEVVRKGMTLDFSWTATARQYEEFYREALHLIRK